MKSENFVFGIIAEVDAGKTTLSEQILFQTGTIRTAGRVDHGDSHLDTDEMEKRRGITCFSSQACFPIGQKTYTLLDTPGHSELVSETEAVLSVLDFCVFVVSGVKGIRGQAKLLWKLISERKIPVILFVNKMDLADRLPDRILQTLKVSLGDGLIPTELLYGEETACLDETLIEQVLNGVPIGEKDIQRLFLSCTLKPVVYGSASKGEGIEKLLKLIDLLTPPKDYPDSLGGKTYKVTHENTQRIAHVKITGGELRVKAKLDAGQVDEIRVYSGDKWTSLPSAHAGMVVQILGTQLNAGDGIGFETSGNALITKPVFSASITPKDPLQEKSLFDALKEIEEELPQLAVSYHSGDHCFDISYAGPLQTEIIEKKLNERYQIAVTFGPQKILYKETIRQTTEGGGHFEPLRHYAEVHLRLEPAKAGSGVHFSSELSEDVLPAQYQKQILSSLREAPCHGVLAGKELTDINIVLVAGRHHIKHTEGGDFREAAVRALRQGLMKANSCILEPWMSFEIRIPEIYLGKVMHEIETTRNGKFDPPVETADGILLTGKAPASCLIDYPQRLRENTKGQSTVFLSFDSYLPCSNQDEVIRQSAYHAEQDLSEPCGSIFCDHGAGIYVDWSEVETHMHLPIKTK